MAGPFLRTVDRFQLAIRNSARILGGGVFPLIVLLLLAASVSAQNPIGNVIRPVVGSRPLAVRTPVVGLAPTCNVNFVGRPIVNRYCGPRVCPPVCVTPAYWPGYCATPYPYYGYGYGYSVTGVGLSVGFVRGNTAISVGFPVRGAYFGGYYPIGWRPYGFYPRRFGAHRFRRVNPLVGGFFSPTTSVAGGYLDSPLLYHRSSPPVVMPTKMLSSDYVLTKRKSPGSNESSFIEKPTGLSSVSDRRHARLMVSNADRKAQQGDLQSALSYSRTAVSIAPELPAGHLRFALALNAIGNFDEAACEFKTAVDFDPALAAGEFKLSRWYGDRADERRRDIDRLVAAAVESKEDSKLLFAAGVMLRLDGQIDRANSLLNNVAELDAELAPSVEQILALTTNQASAESNKLADN